MEIRGATAWSKTIPCIGDSMPLGTWLDGFLCVGKNINHNCEVMDKFSLLGPCNWVACMWAFWVWNKDSGTKLREYVAHISFSESVELLFAFPCTRINLSQLNMLKMFIFPFSTLYRRLSRFLASLEFTLKYLSTVNVCVCVCDILSIFSDLIKNRIHISSKLPKYSLLCEKLVNKSH